MKLKFYSIALLAICSATVAKAQVNYNFSAVQGTFTALTGGTTVNLTAAVSSQGYPASDEGYNNNVPIGFGFKYNGAATNTTSLKVCSNGFVALGSVFGANQDGYWYNNLATGPAQNAATGLVANGYAARRAIIAPFWGDLDVQLNSNLTYRTTGTTPNRVFTLQWNNVKWDYNATAGVIAFQLKLYETTNVIEFVYNQLAGAQTNAAQASIGLTAAGTGVGKFLSVQDASANPTVSRAIENRLIKQMPASGQIYRFTPAAPITNDAAAYQIYSLGKVPNNGEPVYITSRILNIGTAAITNLNTTINVTGANTYTQSVVIPTLDSFRNALVRFGPFYPTVAGTCNIDISVQSDQDSTNNTKTQTLTVTSDVMGTALGNKAPLGVGTQGDSVAVATRYVTANPQTITEIGTYFTRNAFDTNTSTFKTFTVGLFDTTGANGTPGFAYWSQSGLVSDSSGRVAIPVPNIQVPAGGFFVVVVQNDTNNMGLGYESESPIRANTFYFSQSNTGTFVGLASPFKMMNDVKFVTTVPVKFASFTGEKNGKTNKLNWITAMESNNNYFEMERSNDGKNFIKIGTIASRNQNGNSTTNTSYSFNDEKILKGNNYYRLKQIDFDGKSNYSSIVLISSNSSNFELVSTYPNPVVNSLGLKLNTANATKASVMISDMSGKTLLSQPIQVVEGTNNININVESLKAGTYVIRIVSEFGTIQTSRFTK